MKSASFLIPIRSHNFCDALFLASRLACIRCTPNSSNNFLTKLLTASVAYPFPETFSQKLKPISTVSFILVYHTDRSPITLLQFTTAKLNMDSFVSILFSSFFLNSFSKFHVSTFHARDTYMSHRYYKC